MPLPAGDRRVLQLRAKGLTRWQIAARLGVTVDRVEHAERYARRGKAAEVVLPCRECGAVIATGPAQVRNNGRAPEPAPAPPGAAAARPGALREGDRPAPSASATKRTAILRLPVWRQEAEEVTQIAPGDGDRYRFRLLLTLVDQGVTVIPYQVRVSPLRFRNSSPRGQAV